LRDGRYWFHIRAGDAAGWTGKPNWGETVHYGPIFIDTGPPEILGAPSVREQKIIVTYSENSMQGATDPASYSGISFSGPVEALGEDLRIFALPCASFVIYSLTVSENITDATGNSLHGRRSFTLNDDDSDGMADDWEISYGLDPLDPNDAAQDKDGDGHSNLSEYTAGTDPGDGESYPEMTFLVKRIMVTDVTSDGFSVVWQSSEPATCDLVLYDEHGHPLDDIATVSESALYPPAEDIGVMKVRVPGLEPGTLYSFRTLTISKLDGLAVFAPYPGVIDVITEIPTTTVNNDVFKQKIYDEEGYAAEGTLLIASVQGGRYPVSGWVGQGMESPWAWVDLNEIYSAANEEKLQLLGGEELSLWSFGGVLGNYVNVQRVPVPGGVEETALPELSYLSRNEGFYLDLKSDLNLVGIPVQLESTFTSHGLLLYLRQQGGGGAGVVETVKRYDTETGRWETASWFDGRPAGVIFPIRAGEAYLVYMGQDLSDVWFEGPALGAALQLADGLNLVTLPWVEEDFVYSSYDMLQDLGDQSRVSYIKKYDESRGWQTTSWFLGSAAGALYNTRTGEGYLVHMKEGTEGWRPF
jgi:hypothetical protein